MRRFLLILAGLLSLASPALAANTTVTLMTAASAFSGTELLYVVQGAADRKGTPAQFATYIYGLASGDCTISSVGAVVCTKTNGVAFGALATVTPATGVATFLTTPTSANLAAAMTDETGTGANVFGTAPTISSPTINTAATFGFLTSAGTQCVQVSSAGALSGTGAACGGSGSTGANPTATGSDTAVNGVATTFMRSDGAPAIQKASASQFGLVEVDGTTIVATAGVISFNAPINAQVGTTYTVLSTDKGKVITLTNAAAVAVTIPVASTFGSTFYTSFINEGAGLVTLTPTTSTIDGAASLTVKQGQSVDLITDGTNYFTLKGRPTNVACADVSGTACLIASGATAMGTSAIASAACATVVTATATGTATTDVLTASFNGDPTAVTGYIPATAGMLTIIAYPTANTANFKVCNNTSASITPGAITLNWRVVR